MNRQAQPKKIKQTHEIAVHSMFLCLHHQKAAETYPKSKSCSEIEQHLDISVVGKHMKTMFSFFSLNYTPIIMKSE